MKRKKNSDFEEYPFHDESHQYMIRPHVFGSKNKFGEIDDNGRLEKVNGKYVHRAGEVASLRSTRYWFLIHAILRELPMTNRDRFILESHVDGKTARQINGMLKNSDYFKPYRKFEYVNDRVSALIRKYYLTPLSELNF